jgi:hypothetical protein
MNKRNLQYIQRVLVGLLLLSISSCGFSPVYKESGNVSQFLEEIEIGDMDSIEGADFYNRLKNIMPHGNKAKYILTANCSFKKDISIIQKNSDIARESITIKVTYALRDKLTGNQILSEQFSRFSSFNTTFSPYSNNVNQQDVQKNLALISAEEVRNRLIIFVKAKTKHRDA